MARACELPNLGFLAIFTRSMGIGLNSNQKAGVTPIIFVLQLTMDIYLTTSNQPFTVTHRIHSWVRPLINTHPNPQQPTQHPLLKEAEEVPSECVFWHGRIKEPRPILPQESLAQLPLIWPRWERNGKASPQGCLWVTDQCVQTSNCSLLLDVHNLWLLICGSSRDCPTPNLIVCESVCLSFPHCFSILSQGLEIQSTQILANGTQTEKQPAVGSILLNTT